MSNKVTLADVGTLTDVTTAQTVINNNSAAIVAGFDNTLSLDGTQPNPMGANLDMNSNRILNLPTPGSSFEPARLADIEVLTGGGTITVNPLPTGGTTSQVLQKNSNGNFDAGWISVTNLLNSLPNVVNTIDGNAGLFTTGNGINSTGGVIELTPARRTLPTKQIFTSGSGTYVTPACLWIRVRVLGGAGGGGATGSTIVAGGNGNASTFGTSLLTANGGTGGAGGSGGVGVSGGTGGTASGGALNVTGSDGGSAQLGSNGGHGGQSFFGGGGMGGVLSALAPTAGKTNTGSGGGGAGSNFANSSVAGGGGGGAGGYCEVIINTPSSTYSFSVGAGGAGGVGTGQSGAAGGSGIIIVEEFYGS